MTGKIKRVLNLVRNMGWRYVNFRGRYELMRRSGLLKKKFPTDPPFKQYLTLQEWKSQNVKFFFADKESVEVTRTPTSELKQRLDDIKNGRHLLFNSIPADLSRDYDWITNPDSGYRYDVHKHWTEIADFSKEAGDIKFVWEKSRFSYLYDIIRYDYHFGEDCAEFVFADIISWIKGNPINQGPNYRCSQEMSLRVLNWTFALYYYRDSPVLTEEVFGQMQHVIYWHMRHVYDNIEFSRVAVRNNHAITETLALYLVGLLFPALPGSTEWKEKGKKWFEEEITYQVYEDGTYLQFSMNYHRVVVQLLTWAIVLAEKNGERFSDVVYERARKSVQFLRTCLVDENGWLPNYGANDGALFFRLSSSHFRDYRPQLQALAAALGTDLGYGGESEDAQWYGVASAVTTAWSPADGTHSFDKGGYYVIREPETLTFIKCGGYKDRPSHADNLHLDAWYKGENILIDAGSYKYNADPETVKYFSGTQSHNTIMLDDKDQMLKGGRFIWYYWSQSKGAKLQESKESYIFQGTVSAFIYMRKGITHTRTVTKERGLPRWIVKDEVNGAPPGIVVKQLWHYLPAVKNRLLITARDVKGNKLHSHIQEGWYSSLYGKKEKTEECYFSNGNRIETEITRA